MLKMILVISEQAGFVYASSGNNKDVELICYHTILTFNDFEEMILKTLWQKEKMLATSISSWSYQGECLSFYPISYLQMHLNKCKITYRITYMYKITYRIHKDVMSELVLFFQSCRFTTWRGCFKQTFSTPRVSYTIHLTGNSGLDPSQTTKFWTGRN